MNRATQDPIGEGRSLLLEAAVHLDEGEYRRAAEASIRGSSRALAGLLRSWAIEPGEPDCRSMLSRAGRVTPIEVTAALRHCCRQIDRHDAFYGGVKDGPARGAFDEECAMKLVHYGREIVKFAQRNVRREDGADDPAENG